MNGRSGAHQARAERLRRAERVAILLERDRQVVPELRPVDELAHESLLRVQQHAGAASGEGIQAVDAGDGQVLLVAQLRRELFLIFTIGKTQFIFQDHSETTNWGAIGLK